MKRTYLEFLVISIGVEVVEIVKVRAYKRIRFGKVEKVKSYYRRNNS